jgi:hypothetical protein
VSLRRRELVGRGAAAAGGALALSVLGRAAGAAAAPSGDREILQAALRLERGLASLYRELARGSGPRVEEAELFGAQCDEHARGLRIALANRGGPSQRTDPAGLPDAGSAAVLELERAAVAAYYRAHADFGDLTFLPTLTSIMANHGQHLAVLRGRLGEEPATLAFETGGVE